MLAPDQSGIEFINKIRQKDNNYKLSTTIPESLCLGDYLLQFLS